MATASRQLWRRGLQLLAHASDESRLRKGFFPGEIVFVLGVVVVFCFWCLASRLLGFPCWFAVLFWLLGFWALNN